MHNKQRGITISGLIVWLVILDLVQELDQLGWSDLDGGQ